MPIVTVHWFPERTHEMRQKVADGIATVISEATGAPKDIMRVLFVTFPRPTGPKVVSWFQITTNHQPI